jgi:ABC-type Fe3+-hydroxamate transport system substrate-binding protein
MSYRPEPGASPSPVVSLVPSTTESILALGFGRHLIGITDYCPWEERFGTVSRVGGPKDTDPARILALHPQLVFANQEENSQCTVDELQQNGIPVWTAFPKTVQESLEDLKELACLYPSPSATKQVEWLERAVAWLRGSQGKRRTRVFCPVWRSEALEDATQWMTCNADTYASDLLLLCGAENIFSHIASRRYPEVNLEEIRAASPEWVLLPSEPFAFGEKEAAYFSEKLGLPETRVRLCDGRDLFWHGTHLGQAIRTLPSLLAA